MVRNARLATLAAAALAAGVARAQTTVTVPLTGPQLRYAAANFGVTSLRSVAVPQPPELGTYVRNRTALLQLGKALFWESQLGSDGQACASCHFHAGADNRSKNQINPGFRNSAVPGGDSAWNNGVGGSGPSPAFGPNRQLTAADFPLHRKLDPGDRTSPVVMDTNDVVSSQGVFGASLQNIGFPFDHGVPSSVAGPGAVFNVDGVQVRSTPPRNTPSAVNAIFFDRSFWDSRARQEFNGADPIGDLDPTATVVEVVTAPGRTDLVPHAIRLTHASAASQAVGPPLSDLEMSFAGRRYADLGRKMLSATLVPLRLQQISSDDSTLGWLVRPGGKGLTVSYLQLVQAAFQPQWWDGGMWKIDLSSGAPVPRQTRRTGRNVFTVAEANFSLFFGLAIREYEATLVADQTPFDRFMEGDTNALTPGALRGLQVFLGKGGCVRCHGGPELSNAGITNIQRRGMLVDPNGTPDVLERMVMGDGTVAVYDAGFYNIGVRPTAEDIGLGATIGPSNLPLSNTRRLQGCVTGRMAAGDDLATANRTCKVPRILARPFEALQLVKHAAELVGNPVDVTSALDLADFLIGPDDPLLFTVSSPIAGSQQVVLARDKIDALAAGDISITKLLDGATELLPDAIDPGLDELNPLGPPLTPDERVAVDGAFKTPALRNVALTAPYFHNGGQATLAQVVDFYDRGGDFLLENGTSSDPIVRPLFLTDQEQADLVEFLAVGLTDERTRREMAPFDHPSLSLPNGGTPGVTTRNYFSGVLVMDDRVELPAVGAGGTSTPLGTPYTAFAGFLDPLK